MASMNKVANHGFDSQKKLYFCNKHVFSKLELFIIHC